MTSHADTTDLSDSEISHPIIEHPHQYKIIGLDCRYDFDDAQNSYIDMTLQKGATIRRLRFLKPFDLRIREGFPFCSGLQILDISSKQWASATAWVRDFEQERTVGFYAADVIDLDHV